MNILTALNDYPDYLRGIRDSSDNTIKSYVYDAKRYLNFFGNQIDPSLDSFDITPKLMRDYTIYLRQVIKNDEVTVERRLHGVSSLWLYLHHQHDFSPPVSLKICGIRTRKKRKPTPPIHKENFTTILEVIENELSKIK